MTAREVMETCHRHLVVVSREGDEVVLTALFPDRYPLPEHLIELVRQNKSVVLRQVEYEERADEALLESSRRIGEAWKPGCDLDTPQWDLYEHQLRETYWSGDLGKLNTVLSSREDYALSLFDGHRNGAHRV